MYREKVTFGFGDLAIGNKNKNAYLYRAVDLDGNTIDFYVSEFRDKKSLPFNSILKKLQRAISQVIQNQIFGFHKLFNPW